MSERIKKCRAIALRVTNYSNTSQITQFTTDKFGSIGVLAKGSRNPKNKISGILQPLSHYDIVIYKKENSLSLLKEISLIQDNYELFNDIEKTASAQAAAEIYLQLLFEENDFLKFYKLLENYLDYLKITKKNFVVIFWRFFIRVTNYLGFSLTFDKCSFCNSSDYKKMWGINFGNNGFVCGKCAKNMLYKKNFKCSLETISILHSLKNISDKIDTLELSYSTIKEINSTFKNYLSYHLHKNIHLKSMEILFQEQNN